MNANMKLWDQVRVTDPAAVKKITGKSYQGNSPKPYWIIQRATEVFGPVGIGWDVEVKSERFERVSETDTLHVAVVSVWYVLDGVKSSTFDQMGGTRAVYMTGSGKLMVDEDAGKKSVTDGMVKCLSMLGFAGDIFSGMWDDSKYVQWAKEETARREGAEPPPEPAPVIPANDAPGEFVSPDRQAIVNDTADAVKEAMHRGAIVDAYGYATDLTDVEEKRLLWSLLDAPTRKAIKKHGESLKDEI